VFIAGKDGARQEGSASKTLTELAGASVFG
jgi:hypothetical protein